MPVKVAHLKDIAPVHMPGRDLQWIVNTQTIGATMVSACILTAPPKSVVRPLHGHKDVEEALYILQGQGEAWVDGDRAPFTAGDAVMFPANSKHQIRNTGDTPMVVVCMFSAVTKPEDYVNYDRDVFAEG
jgi:mannose-6-phosphate isomerase-like protein (cupin superfamily)